jgi:hypothetical protein
MAINEIPHYLPAFAALVIDKYVKTTSEDPDYKREPDGRALAVQNLITSLNGRRGEEFAGRLAQAVIGDRGAFVGQEEALGIVDSLLGISASTMKSALLV